MQMATSAGSCLLLDHMPPEIRNRIWHFALIEDEYIYVKHPDQHQYLDKDPWRMPALLQTNSHIKKEAVLIYFHNNTFRVELLHTYPKEWDLEDDHNTKSHNLSRLPLNWLKTITAAHPAAPSLIPKLVLDTHVRHFNQARDYLEHFKADLRRTLRFDFSDDVLKMETEWVELLGSDPEDVYDWGFCEDELSLCDMDDMIDEWVILQDCEGLPPWGDDVPPLGFDKETWLERRGDAVAGV